MKLTAKGLGNYMRGRHTTKKPGFIRVCRRTFTSRWRDKIGAALLALVIVFGICTLPLAFDIQGMVLAVLVCGTVMVAFGVLALSALRWP